VEEEEEEEVQHQMIPLEELELE
jgi:hypothetical protein